MEGILDDMTADDYVREKVSFQRALLYFESLFGRPCVKAERDIARPLYDRYRVLKRMVNRNSSLSITGPELPTILENEALAFHSDTVTPANTSPQSTVSCSTIQSPTSDSSTSTSIDTATAIISQNETKLHSMSLAQLISHFDTIKEEKKQLRRSIKEFEHNFEEKNGRKMLKSDRKLYEETYNLYKQKKAKLRLLDALLKKQKPAHE